MGTGPAKVIILSDGIRGHLHQSRGIAFWLAHLTDGTSSVLEVPKLSGWHRFRMQKIGGRFLPFSKDSDLEAWLSLAGGKKLQEEVWMEWGDTPAQQVLFLSTGSSAAPFCFALARMTGARCATIMTPSILGTKPFDFAIIPEHDHPAENSNIFVTLGAPNHIVSENLEDSARELEGKYPATSQKRWGLLLGGDDANYRISASWFRKWLVPLLPLAREEGADLYITTSRRTSPEAEDVLEEIFRNSDNVRMLLLASKDPFNPVPGMLGLCQKVLCTDDSVSMVSEAVTAGRDVALLRTERKSGIRPLANSLCEQLVRWRLLDPRHMSGPARFDRFFACLAEKGYLEQPESPDRIGGFLTCNFNENDRPAFGEARRAAEWLIERWNA